MAEEDEARHLATDASLLGRAFEFADRCLPGGLVTFYPEFCNSEIAAHYSSRSGRGFGHASGIELVLALRDDAGGNLDLMIQDTPRISKERGHFARWCGQIALRYHEASGDSFATLPKTLSLERLRRLHNELGDQDIERCLQEIICRTTRLHDQTQLAIRRLQKSITQTDLARLSGVSLRSIQQYEQRKKDINKGQALSILKLSRVLGCSMEDLIEPEHKLTRSEKEPPLP